MLRSIWIAQLMAAAGGLLFALGVGFCLGYASRMIARAPAERQAEPPPASTARMASAAEVAEAVVVPVEAPAAEPPPVPRAPAAPAASATRVGPPRPPITGPVQPLDETWGLEGVRPPPEHWLHLSFPRQPVRAHLPVYEPMSPPVQLYGRFLPGPMSVESRWQIETPPEWQGAVVP